MNPTLNDTPASPYWPIFAACLGPVMIARSQPKHTMQSRIPIYGCRRPLLGVLWVVVLSGPASEFSGVAPAAVTVTVTPPGSSGIELEHMEQAVDPSRCATNVPQGHFWGPFRQITRAGPSR